MYRERYKQLTEMRIGNNTYDTQNLHQLHAYRVYLKLVGASSIAVEEVFTAYLCHYGMLTPKVRPQASSGNILHSLGFKLP
jgi:hypothetical protein